MRAHDDGKPRGFTFVKRIYLLQLNFRIACSGVQDIVWMHSRKVMQACVHYSC